jgi:two-component system chemotaxis response regulator CheY
MTQVDVGHESVSNEVLLIDDDTDIRDAITQILEYEGYTVFAACNGKEGFEILNTKRPKLILLDLMMPVMNGWEFKTQLNTKPELAQIPVVILSADGNVSERVNAIGVSGYLKKPIQLDTLLDTVKKYLS